MFSPIREGSGKVAQLGHAFDGFLSVYIMYNMILSKFIILLRTSYFLQIDSCFYKLCQYFSRNYSFSFLYAFRMRTATSHIYQKAVRSFEVRGFLYTLLLCIIEVTWSDDYCNTYYSSVICN